MESNFWYIKDAWLNKLDAKLEKELAKKEAKKAQTPKLEKSKPKKAA